MLKILRVKTGAIYHSAGEVLCCELGPEDNWHSAHLSIGNAIPKYRIYFTRKGKHIPDFIDIDESRYQITDSDSIPRSEVAEELHKQRVLASAERDFGTCVVLDRIASSLNLTEPQ